MGLTNAQYDAIMRDYQRLQNQDRRDLDQRREEAYSRIPALYDLDAEISEAGTACAREMLKTENSADEEGDPIRDLREQIALLGARRTHLLKKAGYPADYLTMRYHCPDCQDTGYIDGKKCHCFQQAVIELLYSESNLLETLQDESFQNFSLDYYAEGDRDPSTGLSAAQTARHALGECERFVRDFDEEFENIFLYGDTGLGKTFLSRCIARELLESEHSVLYFSSFRLFDLIADSAFGREDAKDARELEQHIYDCDFLIIDDLGTELVNSFVSSELFHVLNERILRQKSTLISTNLSLETFSDSYSERVFSRISSSYNMLKLIGRDIRLQKKLERSNG